MRIALAALFAFIASAALTPAHADPYRWCAQYGGKSGATNCYFMTIEQCRAAVSGVGGFCMPNGFYTGPDEPQRRPRSHRRRSD
jgi:uncharacterized protein DUF3551